MLSFKSTISMKSPGISIKDAKTILFIGKYDNESTIMKS